MNKLHSHTEASHTFQEIEALHQRSELILASAGEGIYGLDLEGSVTFANPAAAHILGWQVDDLIGQNMHRLMHHSKPNGTPYPEGECPIYAAIKDGTVHRVTDEVFWRKDGSCVPVDYVSTPMKDQGRVIGAVVVFTDITEQKRSERELGRLIWEAHVREGELRKKQEQLIQAGKLATLGEMATAIAHEINNPLNNIALFLGNLIDKIQAGNVDPAMILQPLSDSLKQVNRASEIIAHLRTFGLGTTVGRKRCSVRQVITAALSLLHEQFRLQGVQISFELSTADPMVFGNPIQLEQVVIHLLTNARDAVADAPVKTIHIKIAMLDKMVEISVHDSGPGVPFELQQRIFDPFFTTKDVGAGLGLGLSVSYGIVKAHGGTISVVSPAGEGAKFLLHLPLAAVDRNPEF